MLLWQDVYVWEGLGGAGGVSSSQVSLQKVNNNSIQLSLCSTLLYRGAGKAAKVEKES